MSTSVQIAIVFLALFVGALTMLGGLVLLKVFIGAYQLKAQLGAVPAQLATKAAALAQFEKQLNDARQKLAQERADLEAKGREMLTALPAEVGKVASIAEAVAVKVEKL